jgi:D-alanyl-D-alanine dipeptidase
LQSAACLDFASRIDALTDALYDLPTEVEPMLIIRFLLLGILFCSGPAQTLIKKNFSAMPSPENKKPIRKQTSPVPAGTRQLVLVITPDWNAVDGKLWQFSRADDKSEWQPSGIASSIVVGRSGMAWGRGMHQTPVGSRYLKKEGDGRSPAGIFSLSAAFGYASHQEAGQIRLPYTYLTSVIECVDDSASAHYNTILDRSSVSQADWKSAEKMREQKDFYRWGVTVDHNTDPVKKQAGSCIFLHIWGGTGSGTAGCTAMESVRMESLMRWLDPTLKPVLAQLPLPEYQRLRTTWKLPQIEFNAH